VAAKNDASYDLSRARASVTGQTPIAASRRPPFACTSTRVAGLVLYGTCSARGAAVVSDLGAVPIDYQQPDHAAEVRRLTGDGVDAVFDPLAGAHLWFAADERREHGLRDRPLLFRR